MRIRPCYCKHCGDVAGVGEYKWFSLIIVFIILAMVMPFLIPVLLILAPFNYSYRCPHCGRKLK